MSYIPPTNGPIYAPVPPPQKKAHTGRNIVTTVVVIVGAAVVMILMASVYGSSGTAPAPSPAAAAQAAADGDLSTYRVIDDRTWALVAKDPKGHVGEKYVIYGRVTQFDAATGTSTFRANTGGAQQEQSYNYDVNTMISATDPAKVADIVTDDLVKMYVRVTGALTYDTAIGGSTTVPQVVINSHTLLGHDE